MIAGMAEVLVEHELTAAWLSVDAPSGFACRCGAQHSGTFPALSPRAAYAAHVAEELAKAGYGKLEGAEDEEYDFGNPDPVEVPAAYARSTGAAPFLARFADDIRRQPVASAGDLGRLGIQRHAGTREASHGVD